MRKRSLPSFSALLSTLILLSGCLTEYVRTPNYYILEYYSHLEDRSLVQETPISETVLILDTEIPRTYARRQIVTRGIGPQIQYESNEIWGVDLKDTIADLISRRVLRYNLFSSVQREYQLEQAAYQIQSEIRSIEYVMSRGRSQANLAMEFRLVETESNEVLIRHTFDRLDPLAGSSFEAFVIEVNTIILQETDAFLRQVTERLGGRISSSSPQPPAQADTSAASAAFAGEPAPNADGQGERRAGSGSVFLPAITGTADEPFYRIMGRRDDVIAEARMGEGVTLPAGTYSATVGSGGSDQQMRIDGIRVEPGIRTAVDPVWGALAVQVINGERESLRLRYEIFDAVTGESYGADISSDEEIAERHRIWILEPKIYKIVLKNHPFNSYRNFSTVHVHEGEYQMLTIVMETERSGAVGDMVGAGVIDLLDEGAERGPHAFYSAFNAAGSLAGNNMTDRDSLRTIVVLNGQIDSRYVYERDPLYYTLRNLIEVGAIKGPDTDFRLDSDTFDLRNTLIHYFLRDIGLYTRFDLRTHFFPETYYDSEGGAFRKEDADGVPTDTGLLEDGVRTSPPLFPLTLREGVGVNLRALDIPRASLNLRAGLGFQQIFNNDVYVLTGTESDGTDVYRAADSVYDVGIELSLVGTFDLPLDLMFTTGADVLFPFNADRSFSLEWENLLSLQLFRFVALDYRFTLAYRELNLSDPYFAQDHSLFLRLTYVIR